MDGNGTGSDSLQERLRRISPTRPSLTGSTGKHPDWYDPVPEVFLERATWRETDRLSSEHWAVGVASCNKLLLLRAPSTLQNVAGKPESPPGCLLPNDADLVYKEIVAGSKRPNSLGYINLQ
jgi:hypothetical protein